MSNNKNQQEQPNIENEPVQEQVVQQAEEQQAPKTRKGKVYVKKGIDSRGRPATEGKTTPYGLPVDVDYYKKYYHEKLSIKVQCEGCGLFVCKVNLKKHKLSSYHQRFCQTVQANVLDV